MALMYERRKFPLVGGRRQGEEDDAPRARKDYDHIWEKLSVRFRRKNPFCRFCEQEGFECQPADSVDHIIPLRHGGPRLDWGNLQSLCSMHHYGRKFKFELKAEKIGDISLLKEWCADIKSAPKLTDR